MDPGQQLLSLVNARVARGEDRRAAQHSVFSANPDLADAWHGAGGPVRETEMATYPGEALLQLTAAYERAGLDRYSARRRVFAEHPLVAQAWHEGRTIPKAPQRPRLPGSSGLRRLQSSDERLRPGETMVHQLCSGPDGGFFAIMGA